MTHPTLLAISGSLRSGSFNRKLLSEAVAAFGPAEVLWGDIRMPLYDGDVEASDGIPAQAQLLADQIKAADAIVIAAPEYNKSISGVLKNALDWVSRVPGGVLAGKPVVVITAAAGRTGGETALFATAQVLLQLQAMIVPGPAVMVAAAHTEFDDAGQLKSESYRDALDKRMQALRAQLG